jgi:hypothetical protein
MFSNLRITKIHDTSKYIITDSNLRDLEQLPMFVEGRSETPTVIINIKQLLALKLTQLFNGRAQFPSNQEFLSYLKQAQLLGLLIRRYNDLPLKPTTFTCSDLTLVEADLAVNSNVKYRFYGSFDSATS